MEVIYFDNAATSWPKPEGTILAMELYLRTVGASPGRSGHRLSIEAGRMVLDTREALAELFAVPDPFRIVFTKNATEALNIAIRGLLKPGDHVIASGMEHNSVMRPLRAMEERGVALSVIPCSATGELDPREIIPAIRGNTCAIFLTHASNVTGAVMPVAEVGQIARDRGLVFCVDSAQTAGAFPIDVRAMGIDLLAFTGHKSLFGPQGTGGLYIREGLEQRIDPLVMGGTGSRSEFERQPEFMPDKYESGTPNAVGLAGLGAGVRFVLSKGIPEIRRHEEKLTGLFLDGISDIKGVAIHGHRNLLARVPIVSFSIGHMDPAEVALILDDQYCIMSRAGLHCAPLAHKTIGTYPTGTVRLSFGYFNTEEDVQQAIQAVREIGEQRA